MSLSDDQIKTIARWVDAGAPAGDPKDMPAARQWGAENDWKAAKELGSRISSSSLSLTPWPPTPGCLVEAAVGYRDQGSALGAGSRDAPGNPGRPPNHASRGCLPGAGRSDSILSGSDPDLRGRASLMNGPSARATTCIGRTPASCCCPVRRFPGRSYPRRRGRDSRQCGTGRVVLSQRQEPKYRTYLTGFQALKGRDRNRIVDIAPNSIRNPEFHRSETAGHPGELPTAHASARQGHGGGCDSAGWDHASDQLRRQVQFQLDDELHLRRRRRASASQGTIIRVTAWHDNTRANPNIPTRPVGLDLAIRTVDEMAHAWMNVTYISDEDYNAWVAQHKKQLSANLNR